MKKPFLIFLYMFFIIVIVPVVLTLGIYRNYTPSGGENKDINLRAQNIKVYNVNEDKVVEMDIESYLYNVVASEMPATFGEEALKAQAIAARTYVYNKILNGGDQIPQHKGAVVCTDHKHCQEYLTTAQLEKAHNKYWISILWPKIKKCVNETRGQIITYEGKPIQPLYHSTSGGRTENSEDIFLSKLPYLRSVDSPYEKESPKYINDVIMSKNVFDDKIKTVFGANIKDTNKDIVVISRTQGGSVKEIKLGSEVVKGRDIRSALNLNSSDFDIKESGDKVDIVTRGYGHGVGMSQWGANGMANKGFTYEKILKHYFVGVNIEKKY